MSPAAAGDRTTTGAEAGQRVVPYLCPFCGEEDLRPAQPGQWHCRSCLRVFSLTFHGLAAADAFAIPATLPPDWSDDE